MNKKMFGVLASLFVVAMLALPMSAAFAKKPITLTLTGKYYMMDSDPDHMKTFPAGKSSNQMIKFRDFESVFVGDITGSGVFHSNWKMNPPKGVFTGFFALKDVTIDVPGEFTGTGDLRIGAFEERWTIESGSGDFRSIRGKGTTWPTSMVEWNYELEIQINPKSAD
jgi:hypothetical protein